LPSWSSRHWCRGSPISRPDPPGQCQRSTCRDRRQDHIPGGRPLKRGIALEPLAPIGRRNRRVAVAVGRAYIWTRAQKCRLHRTARTARILRVDQHAFFEFQRDLYRQPTRGGFSTVGTIVTIHRCGLWDRSSWTDRTMPKNLDPFKLSSAVRPLYWAQRQRRASTELLVSTLCTMTSSGRRAQYQSNIN
jgi:hypothetical protein